MRAVIQRVTHAAVHINGRKHAGILNGLLVFLGIEDADNESEANWLVSKIINLRIFNDPNGVMNESICEQNGDILVISQFTLHASTKKGNRPSYIRASKPAIAVPLYEYTLRQFEQQLGRKIFSGVFGADMKVELLNDGPVTIVIDTLNRE